MSVVGTTTAGTESMAAKGQEYFEFERPEVIRLIPPTARRVLDVGCGAGALGAALKRERPGVHVVGLEYVAEAVELARTRLDEVHQVDLNTLDDLFAPEPFDTIVFADVLEHLLDPEATLRALLSVLSPEGCIVASIPNVKHWSVLLPLLVNDRFTYTAAGLLDRTHVHLFTMTEAVDMFERVGLAHIAELELVNMPPEDMATLGPLVGAAAQYGASADRTTRLLSVYQYLFVAARRAAA
ncbi:MAG: methyltransferase domain-containing protein [Austwickia sp.]|nr:methyltransferase domain-containing protein [Austwickia sp.]